ncbi:hypothetical protein [Saccharomonospora azurea]|uniref:Guanylate cyclase domain-containing protein n=1 Tax=Saccharomonospora azurea NA-128 TaxID=882081 RepID=H8G783_9PSEU|nr:hypothetical protein [Saccharomonospora azurea]EHY88322.1 hypothetical protein SacazDRAFT_01392 [Saccharomonospora azurea NA-128]
MDRSARHTEPAELPEYRALLVVDMRGFGSVPGRDHSTLTHAIPTLLHNAFTQCRLDWVLEQTLFAKTTGDGYCLCVPSNYTPFLLNPLLPTLQEVLKFQNTLTTHPIRMRVSVNVGPLEAADEDTISRGSGAARVETHRLLDSDPVRQVLDGAGEVTCVAAIVSDRVFEDAVVPGYAGEHPSLYQRVDVSTKEYRRVAYLRVPEPSGDLLTRGFVPQDDTEANATDETDDRRGVKASGPTATHVTGPVAQSGSRVTTGTDVSGNGNITSGSGNVSGNGNTVTTVQGDQYRGSRYEGDGQIHVRDNTGTIRQSWERRRR